MEKISGSKAGLLRYREAMMGPKGSEVIAVLDEVFGSKSRAAMAYIAETARIVRMEMRLKIVIAFFVGTMLGTAIGFVVVKAVLS